MNLNSVMASLYMFFFFVAGSAIPVLNSNCLHMHEGLSGSDAACNPEFVISQSDAKSQLDWVSANAQIQLQLGKHRAAFSV